MNAKNKISQQKKYCYFCVNNIKEIDYKQADILKRFTSSYAKIRPKRKSHVCSKHQRQLSQAIKRARIMALLPFMVR